LFEDKSRHRYAPPVTGKNLAAATERSKGPPVEPVGPYRGFLGWAIELERLGGLVRRAVRQ